MKKLFLVLCCTSFLLASQSTTKQASLIIENGKTIGTIPVLTTVEVQGVKKDIATIKVQGWRNENYPQEIVRDIKRREIYALIEDEKIALKIFKVIKSEEDEYGEVWQKVEGVLHVNNNSLTDNTEKLYEEAQKTYKETCSMCHRMHEPNSFTVNQWPHQIETMMEQVALEKPTKNLIVKYLQQNASDAK